MIVDAESHHLPVVEDGKPFGMISLHDLLTLFASSD
ncbi:MAG: CBS domain-containing protein [Chloroflexi bacterium]|jgi:signal-transduction protein with cAMP-binding, CBS, and nucleotidyltransferase domain|nr:CBS domain-containing protein [Chloroflexota bacterium]MBT6707913.1 CBS domain-containing protein [Chloroflexota bacterium]